MSHEMNAIKNYTSVTIRPVQNGYIVTHPVSKEFAFSHWDEMQEYLYRFWHGGDTSFDETIDTTNMRFPHE